jgi:hypothetical protein
VKASKNEIKCGLVMPIAAIDGCSEGHWEDVRTIIKEALSDTDFQVELVSTSNEVGIIQKRIVQNIYDNDMVIVDVSAKNPNVMFELGLRLAFDKPAIIIKDDRTSYSFDTGPIEHIEYPRDLNYHAIQAFKKKLREKTSATFLASKEKGYTTFLGHFGKFVVAKLDEEVVGADKFLLESVLELRKEVQMLSRVASFRPESLLNPSVGPMGGVIRNHQSFSELDFVRKITAGMKTDFSWDEITDPSSNAFNAIVNEYCDKYVPENIARKDRHRTSIAKRILEALVELKALD